MKNIKYLSIALLSVALLTLGCKDKAEEKVQETPEPQPIDFSNPPAQTNNNNQATTPGQNTAGVYHYTCANGCAGGAAAAGNCGTCGNALVHNQAYHANNNNANNANTPAPFTTPQAEPAQNAAGVYHYTCSNGCAGGAASAGNCSNCGNALAHNSAYHQ